jgi:hypothetical protein
MNRRLAYFLLTIFLLLHDARSQLVDTEVAKSSLEYLSSSRDLNLPVVWAKNIFKQATIGSMVQPIAYFIAKSTVIAFITAEILAYLGVIGERGEGLYEWAVDNHVELNGFLRKWGSRPGSFVRHQLYQMLSRFKKMPPKAKFVSAVSTGVTFMPLAVKTAIWACSISFVVYAVAEFLSLVGVLGDPGEPLATWVHEGEAEPLLRSMRRLTNDLRILLKRKLKVHEIIVGFITSIRNDNVFWIGFSVGGAASLLLPVYFP